MGISGSDKDLDTTIGSLRSLIKAIENTETVISQIIFRL